MDPTDCLAHFGETVHHLLVGQLFEHVLAEELGDLGLDTWENGRSLGNRLSESVWVKLVIL